MQYRAVGCLQNRHSANLEYTVKFRKRAPIIPYVLQHVVGNHHVERMIGKWNVLDIHLLDALRARI